MSFLGAFPSEWSLTREVLVDLSLLPPLPVSGAVQTWTAFTFPNDLGSVFVIPGNTTQAPVPFLQYVGTLTAVDKDAAVEQTRQYLEAIKSWH